MALVLKYLLQMVCFCLQPHKNLSALHFQFLTKYTTNLFLMLFKMGIVWSSDYAIKNSIILWSSSCLLIGWVKNFTTKYIFNQYLYTWNFWLVPHSFLNLYDEKYLSILFLSSLITRPSQNFIYFSTFLYFLLRLLGISPFLPNVFLKAQSHFVTLWKKVMKYFKRSNHYKDC